MSEHSPTPWKFTSHGQDRCGNDCWEVYDANGSIVACCDEESPHGIKAADMEHAVRCVNLREELVKALGSLRQEHQSLCDATEWGVEDHNRKLLDAIDSLLAKAKGEA